MFMKENNRPSIDPIQDYYDRIGIEDSRFFQKLDNLFWWVLGIFTLLAVIGMFAFFLFFRQPRTRPVIVNTSAVTYSQTHKDHREWTPGGVVALVINLVAAYVWTEARNKMHYEGLRNYKEYYNHIMEEDEG